MGLNLEAKGEKFPFIFPGWEDINTKEVYKIPHLLHAVSNAIQELACWQMCFGMNQINVVYT